MTDPTAMFEVLSLSSVRTDRFVKVKEYQAVPSIRRYFVVESTVLGVTAYHRQDASAEWRVTPIIAGESLMLPELGIEVPLSEVYEDTGLPETEPDAGR